MWRRLGWLLIGLLLGLLLAPPLWAYDSNESLWRVSCPGWGAYNWRVEEVVFNADDYRAHVNDLAGATAARMRDVWGANYTFQTTTLSIGANQFVITYDAIGPEAPATVTCTGVKVAEPRASLDDLSNDQGSQIAAAVGLLWAVAWCFRKVADAINATDGPTAT